MDLKNYIDEVQDFPKKWINFKDITPILKNPEVFRFTINEMSKWVIENKSTVIAWTESRGFIFGSAVAFHLWIPFVLIRKPWKLPKDVHSHSYSLEYWEDTLEIHKEDISKDDRVFLIDDLLATWWTMEASIELVKKSWAEISWTWFLIELDFLNWRNKFDSLDVRSLILY